MRSRQSYRGTPRRCTLPRIVRGPLARSRRRSYLGRLENSESEEAQPEKATSQGPTRVDLTGKTVIPALVDIHNHLGWTNQKTNKATKDSYTRELVIDHLATLCVLRRRGDPEHGPRPMGRQSGTPLPVAQRNHPECGAIPYGGAGDRRDVHGGAGGGLSAGCSVRRTTGLPNAIVSDSSAARKSLNPLRRASAAGSSKFGLTWMMISCTVARDIFCRWRYCRGSRGTDADTAAA